MSDPMLLASEQPAPRWAIVEWDSKTGQVQLILWAPDIRYPDAAEIQEKAMMTHPAILKAWRLEEIK